MACPDHPPPRPHIPGGGPVDPSHPPSLLTTQTGSGGQTLQSPNPIPFFSAPHTSPSLTRVSLTRGPVCGHVADMLRVCVSLQGPLQQPDRLSHLRNLPGPPQAPPTVSAGRGRLGGCGVWGAGSGSREGSPVTHGLCILTAYPQPRENLRSHLPVPLQKHIWKHLLQSATWGL